MAPPVHKMCSSREQAEPVGAVTAVAADAADAAADAAAAGRDQAARGETRQEESVEDTRTTRCYLGSRKPSDTEEMGVSWISRSSIL